MRLLADLIANLHVLALGIELELTTDAFFGSPFESTVRRSRPRCVGIGLDLDRYWDGCWWRRRRITGVCLTELSADFHAKLEA